MSAAESIYELLTKVDRQSYSPNSFPRKLQTACEPIDVTLEKDKNLSRHGFEILPGRHREKTGLMLSLPDGPDNPVYSHRACRDGFSFLQEKAQEAGYDALVSIGPHSIEYVTSTDAHKYLTTQVDEDISDIPHVSHLSAEACTEVLEGFFNQQLATQPLDSEQESLEDF